MVNRDAAVARWIAMLKDEASLLEHPGAHHKLLLSEAHALHRAQIINRDDLSDLLEQADGALAYAVETLFDHQPGK
ncbi:hypothetical protein C1890_24820 [Pseudomonas sp. DP16D-R1]|nr:hypothetical protein [Pseudomonas sp. DP16D-R1]POA74771.1 hypothetical protein C1890_24820 [Pseudomonas sp. DP16D-R1]